MAITKGLINVGDANFTGNITAIGLIKSGDASNTKVWNTNGGVIDLSSSTILGAYVKKSGDTMTGMLSLKADQYTDSYSVGGLDAKNSNIIGVNSIYFADKSDNSAEGIHFYRDTTHTDSIWVKDGVPYFTPNRPIGGSGTDNKIWHAGNDGNGSGLDADTLDGNHASAFVTALGTSGNNLTWTKNGTANTLPVPYAAKAGGLNGGAKGSIPYQSAANTTAFLGIGSTGQVLSVSSSGLPAWVNSSTGGSGHTYNSTLDSLAEGVHTTEASGGYSHAEGNTTEASGDGSHAEGTHSLVKGCGSHVEGHNTTVIGDYAHGEGYGTSKAENFISLEDDDSSIFSTWGIKYNFSLTKGTNSHTEGHNTLSLGGSSHAEGYRTCAKDDNSHAEGHMSIADGSAAHAEGSHTTANGIAAHAEGLYTQANDNCSHAEGHGTVADGHSSHAEGAHTFASDYAHAEGLYCVANKKYSHVEGTGTVANGRYSHAEGSHTTTLNNGAHSEGYYTEASGYYSHAEGEKTIAIGSGAHAEGIMDSISFSNVVTSVDYCSNTEADSKLYFNPSDIGQRKVIVGSTFNYGGTLWTIIRADYIGETYRSDESAYEYDTFENVKIMDPSGNIYWFGTEISANVTINLATSYGSWGDGSHSEGYSTLAAGHYSHSEGQETSATGFASHAGGIGTIANNTAMTAIGKYNAIDSGKLGGDYLFTVGNGTASTRKNLFSVTTNGITASKLNLSGGDYQHNNFAGTLNFGDGNYVYLTEDVDDHLKIYGSKGIRITSAGSSGSGDATGKIRLETTANNRDIELSPHGTGAVVVSTKVNAQSGFFQTSDIRKKNVIGDLDLDKAYEFIDKCQTILYTLKDDQTNKHEIGLIAQEVNEFFPELVSEGDDGILSLDYSKLTVIILKLMKDLIKRISKLENK